MQLSSFNKVLTYGKKTKIKITLSGSLGVFLANADVKVTVKYSESNEIITEKLTFVCRNMKAYAVFSTAPTHIGEMLISVDDVNIYDYMGLFSTRKAFSGVQKLYVMPELLPVSSDEHKVREITDNDLVPTIAVAGDGDEIIDLKEMSDGDDFRKIHWKMSANHPDEEFVIKQYAQIEQESNYIIVDLSLDTDRMFTDEEIEKFRYNLDKIYQVALSIVGYHLDNDMESSLVFWNDKNKKMMVADIKSVDDFKNAAIELMSTPCSRNALIKTCDNFRINKNVDDCNPVVVTADDIKSDTFHVVNVLKMRVNEVFKK
ncbi:MAG: DUF58 domain-containing protein [Lachnospira sp.]